MAYEQLIEGGAIVTQPYGCTQWARTYHTEWDCPGRGCPRGSFGFHAGIDLAQAPGRQPVMKAVGYGTRVVRLRDPGSCGGLGPFAVCINSGPVDIWYGHCSKDLVGIGAQVVPGQPIAVMGTLGCSNGMHLHFEVQPAGSVYGCNSLDPTPYLTRWPGAAPGPPSPVPPGSGDGSDAAPGTPSRAAWALAAGAGLLLVASRKRD